MSYCLNNAVIYSQTSLDKVLAVACYRRGNYFDSVSRKRVDIFKLEEIISSGLPMLEQ